MPGCRVFWACAMAPKEQTHWVCSVYWAKTLYSGDFDDRASGWDHVLSTALKAMGQRVGPRMDSWALHKETIDSASFGLCGRQGSW